MMYQRDSLSDKILKVFEDYNKELLCTYQSDELSDLHCNTDVHDLMHIFNRCRSKVVRLVFRIE